MKLLVDTNVYVDYLARRSPYDEDIRTLCIASHFNDVELWVNLQSIADAEYILRKAADVRTLRTAMRNSLALFHPCAFHASDIEAALASDWPELEDYLIVASAEHIGAEAFITRDVFVKEHCPIPAYTPAEYVQVLRDRGLHYETIQL